MKDFRNNTTIKAKTNLMTNMIDQELVMMSPKHGSYFGLNTIGTKIWELIQEEINFKSLIEKLVQIYSISSEDCKNQVIDFLETLQKNDLVHIKR